MGCHYVLGKSSDCCRKDSAPNTGNPAGRWEMMTKDAGDAGDVEP